MSINISLCPSDTYEVVGKKVHYHLLNFHFGSEKNHIGSAISFLFYNFALRTYFFLLKDVFSEDTDSRNQLLHILCLMLNMCTEFSQPLKGMKCKDIVIKY